MGPYTIHYEFFQNFSVEAEEAFAWCTDYHPDDMMLMQETNATRKVQRIAEDIVLLLDEFSTNAGKIEKRKLVCLYPNKLSWTSTHLTGPNKYSQFLYEITALNERKSQLKFTALFLDYKIENKDEAKNLSRKLEQADSQNWYLLAHMMKKQVSLRHHGRRSERA